jgi:hypothetical protein
MEADLGALRRPGRLAGQADVPNINDQQEARKNPSAQAPAQPPRNLLLGAGADQSSFSRRKRRISPRPSSAFAPPQPVLDDRGFDSWKIQSTVHAYYVHPFTPEEVQSAMMNGWEMTARFRFAEVGPFAGSTIALHMGNVRFRLWIDAISENQLGIGGSSFSSFLFETDALAYHEYRLVFNPILDEAALWIDGSVKVTGIPPQQIGYAASDFRFGDPSEGITNSHWNEVTFRIIPEPATVALLSGLGALLLAGAVRRRRRASFGP